MSGWVKWEKDIESDPRFLRMVRALRVTHMRDGSVTDVPNIVTLACGALIRFWSYTDSHIRSDDTLDLGSAEIDDLVGLRGFTESMPADWLRIIDEHSVELPGYQEHNGVEAKKRDLAQKRQERKRTRERVTPPRDMSVTGALPDQTRPDQTKEKTSAAARPVRKASRGTQIETDDWFLNFKLAFPDRSGSQPWKRARNAANARIAEGHTPEEFLAGAKRYAEFVTETKKANTEFVMQAATFLGPDKQFLLPWTVPETPATRAAAQRTEATERALVGFRARAEKIGFRDFIDGEDVLGYGTLVERAENSARDRQHAERTKRAPQPIAKLLGSQPP